MAKGATIYKIELNVADIDRDYYAEHSLTIALHPSETPERMLVRVLAFALFAHDDLSFGGGVSTQGEPALWHKDLTGAVQLWIELGHPDERDLRRACGKSPRVVAICYGGRASALWWSQNEADCGRLKNLAVLQLPSEATQRLGRMARRTMQIQCNIQDGAMTIIESEGDELLELELEWLQGER
ncbi:MAG: YaeQ family protein [bacterium]|nr:YaeQ family protein [bacterium]